MRLEDTVLLAAETPRTNAYVQALAKNGIQVKGAVLFGEKSSGKPGQTQLVPERNWPDAPVFLPDLAVPLTESLDLVSDTVITVVAAHVNEPSINEALRQFNPGLIVYSGYGSQIVGNHLLSSGIPMLHLHSGWLPEFRGSTTTYFHLLVTGDCGVSALLFDKDIDTGPVLARKKYPPPPPDVDIDYLYDSAIRADLLVKVLDYYGKNQELPERSHQHQDEGNTYFIIHPVLKHIAISSLKKS